MADNNKAVGSLAAAKLVTLIKAETGKKYDRTGGKIDGSAEITGGLKVGMSSEFSSSIKAGSEISSDMLLMAPIVALYDPAKEESISFGVSGENAAKVTSPVSGGGIQYARLAVGTPTGDNDAATKQYVDSKASGTGAVRYDAAQTLTDPQKLQARKNIDALGSVAPNIQNYMVITPPGQDAGIGVALSARGTGGDFTLDIADVNEGNPTKLMGVKTPIDAETHAAANVEYVLNKLAGATDGTVDAVMSDTSTNAVQNKVIKKYVDDSAAKKLDQETPIIKDGVTLDSGGYQLYAQLQSQSSVTGDEVIELNLADDSPESTGIEVVISGLADFGDAEAAGMPNTAVSYAQLLEYTKPLLLTYDNNQVTGASYADIRKAITRGRQIKLAVANTIDIIASNARNETNKSVLMFTNTGVGGDTVSIAQYTVTAQASGLTCNVKSHELA